jgi:hypothetical protein
MTPNYQHKIPRKEEQGIGKNAGKKRNIPGDLLPAALLQE